MTVPVRHPPAERVHARRRTVVERRAWITTYVAVLLGPSLLMPFAPEVDLPIKQFAIALGFAIYMGMALQVVVAARLPVIARPIGIDVLLRLHRYMGVVLLCLVVAHVVAFLLLAPKLLDYLLFVDRQPKAWTGAVAFYAMVALAVTSIWRARLGWSYETWRAWHIALTAAAMFGAYVHILGSGDFTAWGPLRTIVVGTMVVTIATVVYLRFGRAFRAAGVPYLVESVRAERGDSVTVRLLAHGHGGLQFRPGDFAWLRFSGAPYALTEHPFSVASSTRSSDVVEFTCKVVGDLTSSLRLLAPGSTVYVDGPHGVGRPALDAAGHVLVSAGIGITPAMSLIRTLADLGQGDTPVLLVHGARRLDDVTFREELEELEQRLPGLRVVLALSRPEPGWSGHIGRIDGSLIAREAGPAAVAGHEVFACGPIELLDQVQRTFAQLGVPADQVHVERFEGV